jgi:hypothetical protein
VINFINHLFFLKKKKERKTKEQNKRTTTACWRGKQGSYSLGLGL